MKSAPIAVLLFAISACQKPPTAEDRPPEKLSATEAIATPLDQGMDRVIYIAENANHADVFDLRVNSYAFRSKDQILQGELDIPTELGSSLQFCDENNVRCLEIGLVVAVPKQRPIPENWNSSKISCQQVAVARILSATEFSAECVFGRELNRKTVFAFDLFKGITWYRRECAGCDDDSFILYSGKGLFAGP